MPKRKDENPQWLSASAVATVPGTTQSWSVSLPQNRAFAPTGSKASVIEVLKVVFYAPGVPNFAGGGAEVGIALIMALSTRDHADDQVELTDADMISMISLEAQGLFSATGGYGFVHDRIVERDITDLNGNGILVATDQIYMQLAGTAAWATSMAMRILYRFKEISLLEFVGMMQSQQ